MRLVLSRSVIRDWDPSDAESLVRHANDHEVWRRLRDQFPHPYTSADAEAWIAKARAKDPPTSFAVAVNGEAAGGIGVHPQNDVYRLSAELGYWLGRDHWGKGIMSEAVAAVTDWAFDALGVVRVFASALETNPASARVLEKAGFVFEGTLRRSVIKEGRIMDSLLYAKVTPSTPAPAHTN